ncbi:MAG: tetratricopeptide repeat protein [Flavobacteriaceae bacterium]
MKNVFLKLLFISFFISCGEQRQASQEEPKGIMWFNENPLHREIIIEGIRHFENIEFEKAYVYFEKAIRLDSTLFAPHVMLASLSRPNSEQQEYHYERAKKLVQDKNENSKRFVSLLDIKNESGKRNMLGRGEKTKIWDAMIKDAPNGPFIQVYHAWSRTTLEERIEALENLLSKRKESGEINNGHILNALGYSYMQSGDLDKAKSFFEEYIESYPSGYNPYDSMGEFYFLQKDYENAKIYYEMALNIFPAANSANQKLKEINTLNIE